MIQFPTIRSDIVAACSNGHDAVLQARIERALGSAPMHAIRSLLDPMGLTIERTPIVHKYLSQQHLRLMFPVTAGPIEQGTVVSIVCLYDCPSEQTLYAHPMHAGPEVNPLLKHPDGPMASPKAQPGPDGDRATARMIAHKRALWQRFLQDVGARGVEEASSRWRTGYYWALRRLYFCTRCSFCRWGTPFFDGPDSNAPSKASTHPVSSAGLTYTPAQADCVAGVLSSDIWKTETSYARRGGFAISECPRIIRELDGGFLQLAFPANALLIQGGTIVSVSVVYSTRRRDSVFAHCLSAGPEPDIQFLLGDEVLGLPRPCNNASEARSRYTTWRREAWSQFSLDELDYGIAYASARWLKGFWLALERLFEGNDLPAAPKTLNVNTSAGQDGEGLCCAARPPVSRSQAAQGTAKCFHAIRAERPDAVPAIPFETLENIGRMCFAGHAVHRGFAELRAIRLTTLMVNMGLHCNQSCGHCHVDAGPHRTEEMSRETVDRIVGVLQDRKIDTLDITGGAPEMNPHFRYLASRASELCERVVDRCNLTILLEPGYEDLAAFLAEHGIEVTASLPHYEAQHVDRQRGRGVFEKSIEALRRLNALGYGLSDTPRILNLVYNPAGTDLAGPQEELEERFKYELRDRFGIVFNRLFAMNNMPVNRFREQLVREGRLESYMDRLVGAFNPATVGGFMCRHSLSVGWDGTLYDCDFNQAASVSLRSGLPKHIRDWDVSALRMRAINTSAHCFGCAAGHGSSCNGALGGRPGHGDSRRGGRSAKGVTVK